MPNKEEKNSADVVINAIFNNNDESLEMVNHSRRLWMQYK